MAAPWARENQLKRNTCFAFAGCTLKRRWRKGRIDTVEEYGAKSALFCMYCKLRLVGVCVDLLSILMGKNSDCDTYRTLVSEDSTGADISFHTSLFLCVALLRTRLVLYGEMRIHNVWRQVDYRTVTSSIYHTDGCASGTEHVKGRHLFEGLYSTTVYTVLAGDLGMKRLHPPIHCSSLQVAGPQKWYHTYVQDKDNSTKRL